MHRALLVLVYGLIFATGAAGLVYQIVWQRYLARLLGSDSVAIAIILAVFLGGLSLGYWLCGLWTKRLKNFLGGYAVLELVIGLWALSFPMLFESIQAMTDSWSFAPTSLLLVQGIVCAVALTAIPAICMGGTIPTLTRGLSINVAGATRTHAMIYGINAAGACAGALLAGFFLIATFGLPVTLRIAATINFIAAAVFAALPSRQPKADAPETNLHVGRLNSANSRWMLYAIGFLSGAYVMMLENVLVRIVNLSFGSSSYSFSIIVSIFVLCIALGSFVVGKRKTFPASLLFWNQICIVCFLLLLFLFLDKGPYFAHLLRLCFQSNFVGFWFYYTMIFISLLVLLLLPISFAGATLPLLFHELKRDLSTVGAKSGALFSLNALGCMLGSLSGGMLLYSLFNSGEIFLCASGLAAVAALLAGWSLPRRNKLIATGLLATTIVFIVFKPFFQPERFAVGTFRLMAATPFSFVNAKTFYEEFNKEREIKFLEEGPAGTVAVIENHSERVGPIGDLPFEMPFPAPHPQESTRSIYVNGKSDSDVVGDRETLKLLAHLPALWSEKRERAFIIGLGTGVTAGELALYPELELLEVAEISPTVVQALPHFAKFTGNVHEDPRLKIHVGDAFRVLHRSREKWDMIISEPSNLWMTGVDQLFSREFYQLAKKRLSEDGVFVQWVQQYAFSTEGFGIILATLKTEFPHFAIFQGTKGDFLVLAREQPFKKSDRDRINRAFDDHEAVRKSLAEMNIQSPKDLFRRERPMLAAIFGQFKDFGIETLDRPRLHFLAGKTFFSGQEIGGEVVSPFGRTKTVISRQAFEEMPETEPK